MDNVLKSIAGNEFILSVLKTNIKSNINNYLKKAFKEQEYFGQFCFLVSNLGNSKDYPSLPEFLRYFMNFINTQYFDKNFDQLFSYSLNLLQ